MKLEKQGRYTYLLIGTERIKCASAKSGQRLLDALQSQPPQPAPPQAQAPPAPAPKLADVLAKAESAALVPALVAALDREVAERERFRSNRRVWRIEEAWMLGRGMDPVDRPRLEPWTTWVLDDNDRNVEVDGQTQLQKEIDECAQTVKAGHARNLIEASHAGGFHLFLTQPEYRVTNHGQLEQALSASNFWNRQIPNVLAQACFLRGWLSEVWNLDSAVVVTRDGYADLGFVVNEAWASSPEQLVFLRVAMSHDYPGHIFDPHYPLDGSWKKHMFPTSYADKEGLILY